MGKHYENPFDITKIWRHAGLPLHEASVLELNRDPEGYFAEAEQAALTPAHVVPRVGSPPDKSLQGWLFVYDDAQRYRPGVNYDQIPVNRAKHGVYDCHRDDLIRIGGNYGGASAYSPNGQGEWTVQPEVVESPLDLSGALYACDPQDDPMDDHFRAGRDLWGMMMKNKYVLLIENTTRDIKPVTNNVKYRYAIHYFWADEEHSRRMTEVSGPDVGRIRELAKGGYEASIKAAV